MGIQGRCSHTDSQMWKSVRRDCAAKECTLAVVALDAPTLRGVLDAFHGCAPVLATTMRSGVYRWYIFEMEIFYNRLPLQLGMRQGHPRNLAC